MGAMPPVRRKAFCAKSCVSAPAPQDGVTVEEQVLMEQDGIKVTLTGIDAEGFMGPELKILAENDSDKPVIIQTADASINGIMANPSISCNIEPGKKANDSITFSASALEAACISTIKDVEIKLLVLDPDTFQTIYKTDAITVSTSATDYVQEYDDSGSVALDRDGYKVVVKRLDSEESIFGAELYVYVENNSAADANPRCFYQRVYGQSFIFLQCSGR